MFPSPTLRLLLRRFALLLGVYTLLRLGFYLLNFGTFREVGAGAVLLAFGHGLRFDVSGLLWLNLPLVLLSLLVRAADLRRQRWLRGLYVALNAPGIAINRLTFQPPPLSP